MSGHRSGNTDLQSGGARGRDDRRHAGLVPRSMPLVYAWIESERPATMSDEQYAANPRADVNQDGVVDVADLMAIRAPENWQRKVRPPDQPEPDLVLRYEGTNQDGCALDVRTSKIVLANAAVRSTAHGIVASRIWQPHGLTLSQCDIETEGYGLYSEASALTVRDTVIAARRRDPIRIAGGEGLRFERVAVKPTESAAAWRIHGDPRDGAANAVRRVLILGCSIEGCWPWGIDLGEQYRGAGGIVDDVIIEDCVFHATPNTRYGIRIRARRVTVRDCAGVGFDKAAEGAALVQIERHNIDPTGCVIEGCTCDGGRPVVGNRWSDTVIR